MYYRKASNFNYRFTNQQKSFKKINQEKGASTCLSTLPLKKEGCSLSKQSFWDLAKIRYG